MTGLPRGVLLERDAHTVRLLRHVAVNIRQVTRPARLHVDLAMEVPVESLSQRAGHAALPPLQLPQAEART
eukprot:9318720-Alexandrium_andersonii.AAC.1